MYCVVKNGKIVCRGLSVEAAILAQSVEGGEIHEWLLGELYVE